MNPGSRCTKKHCIANLVFAQVCDLQAILTLIGFHGIKVCRPLRCEMSQVFYANLKTFQSIFVGR